MDGTKANTYGFFSDPSQIFELGELVFKFSPFFEITTNGVSHFQVKINWKRFSDGLLLEHDELFSSISDGAFLVCVFNELNNYLTKQSIKLQHKLFIHLTYDQLASFAKITKSAFSIDKISDLNITFLISETDLGQQPKEHLLENFGLIAKAGISVVIENFTAQIVDISFIDQLKVFGVLLSQQFSLELLLKADKHDSLISRECQVFNMFFSGLEFVCCSFTSKDSRSRFQSYFATTHFRSGAIDFKYDLPDTNLNPLSLRNYTKDDDEVLAELVANTKNLLPPSKNNKINDTQSSKLTIPIVFALSITAIGVCAAGFHVFSKRLFNLVANNALINAPFLTLKAPSDAFVIENIAVRGDEVKKGQILTVLQLVSPPANELNQILLKSNKESRDLQSDILSMSTKLLNAKTLYETNKSLYSQNAISEIVLNNSATTYRTLKAMLNSLNDLAIKNKAERESVSLTFWDSIKSQYPETTYEISSLNEFKTKGIFKVKSPKEGFVYENFLAKGDIVYKNSELASIVECENAWIEVNMSADNARDINRLAPVKIQLVNHPDKSFTGFILDVIPGRINDQLSKSQPNQFRGIIESYIPAKLQGKPVSKVIVKPNSYPLFLNNMPYCGIGSRSRLAFEYQK